MPLDDLRNWQTRELEKTKALYFKTIRRAEEDERRVRGSRPPDAYFTSDPIGNWLANRVVAALKFIGALFVLVILLGILAIAKHL